jgi:tRNA U34 5-carboxymethylaminomethyl modifying enzyme MnmG/GidA
MIHITHVQRKHMDQQQYKIKFQTFVHQTWGGERERKSKMKLLLPSPFKYTAINEFSNALQSLAHIGRKEDGHVPL